MYPTFPHPAVTPTMLRIAMSRWLNQNRATISAIRSVTEAEAELKALQRHALELVDPEA
jgi:hypothetical protein